MLVSTSHWLESKFAHFYGSLASASLDSYRFVKKKERKGLLFFYVGLIELRFFLAPCVLFKWELIT